MNSKNILIVVSNIDNGGVTSALKNLCAEYCSVYNIDVLNLDGKTLPDKEINFIKIPFFLKIANISVCTLKNEKNLLKKLGIVAIGSIKKILGAELWQKLCFTNNYIVKKYSAAIAFTPNQICFHFLKKCVHSNVKVGVIHSELKNEKKIDSWMKYADAFKLVGVSEAISEQMKILYPQYNKNIFTLYNMFPIDKIKKQSIEYYPKEYEKDNVEFRIVTLTRMYRAKGIFRIVEAVKKIKSLNIKKVKWYVIGDGNDKEVFLKQISEFDCSSVVEVVDWKENPFPYLKNADLFAFPTYSEAYPMVVIESMILNTPVLTTEYCSANEQIKNNKNGIIVENNSTAFCDGIIDLIENKDKVENMREYLNNNPFTIEKAKEQFESVMEL